MADIVYNAFLEEDEGEVWYTAIAEPGCEKGSACIAAQGDTYEELKRDILQSIQDCLQLPHHEETGIPKNPSVAVRFTEEIYPGTDGEVHINAEMNCKAYQTVPNGMLGQKYSHETVEGLRALVKEAVQKANPNGKKVTLVLEEVLQQ
ncbi:hypothetical protein KY346_00310 [Candidatus Woesearchaeota archaeon]|nr:hypothetical protein [Candidatus Woesearchaeota archaeon]